jgi:hypothetical protein
MQSKNLTIRGFRFAFSIIINVKFRPTGTVNGDHRIAFAAGRFDEEGAKPKCKAILNGVNSFAEV